MTEELTRPQYPFTLSYNDIEILQLSLNQLIQTMEQAPHNVTLSPNDVLRALGLPPEDTDSKINLEATYALQFADAKKLYKRLTELVGHDTMEG